MIPDELAAISPNLVLSAVSWFGQTGPYANFAGGDGVCHALIGMLRGIGPVSGPPVMPTGYHAQIVGGLTAYIGTLGQVLARELGNATGLCALDTSIFEANLCFTDVGGVDLRNGCAFSPRGAQSDTGRKERQGWNRSRVLNDWETCEGV